MYLQKRTDYKPVFCLELMTGFAFLNPFQSLSYRL